MWYCRHEIQFRQAMFFSAASIAGAFSGLLAFGISKMDGVGNLEGWRWIFILEGIATVLVALAAYGLLHDFPETAKFLTEEERAFVVYRLKYQGQASNAQRVAQAEEFQWKYVGQAFSDCQIWLNIFVYWGVSRFSAPKVLAIHTQLTLTCRPRSSVLCTASACSSPPLSRASATPRAPHSS